MYLYVSRVAIYVVTSEWFLCISCETGGERAEVPEYVGQEKRSVWGVSSAQSPAVLGELLVPRGWACRDGPGTWSELPVFTTRS